MFESRKRECFCERSNKEQSARKISRCAPHDGMGGMGLFHVAYNGYVGKALPVASSRAKPRDLSCTPV